MKIRSFRVFNYRSIDPHGIEVLMGRFTSLVGANNTGKTSLLLALVGGLDSLTQDVTGWNQFESLLLSPDNRFINPFNLEMNVEPSGVAIIATLDRREIEGLVSLGTLLERRKVRVDPEVLQTCLLEQGMVFTVDFHSIGELRKNNKPWTDYLGPIASINRQATKKLWKDSADLTEEQGDLALDHLTSNPDNWTWLKEFEVIYVEANRGGYSATHGSGGWDYRNLVGYYAERQPGELAQLVEALNTPARRRDRQRFLQYVQIVIPEINEIMNRQDELGRHVYISQNKHEQPLYRSGSGIANVLYICARVLQAVRHDQTTGVIIIDEPEAGLHPDLHRRLMALAAQVYRDHAIQWIMGTHSPYLLLETLGADDRVSMTRLDEGRTVLQPIESANQLAELYEAIGFYLPSVLSSRGVIFVEGATELEFLKELLPRLGVSLDKQRLVISPIGGNAIISQVEPEDLSRIHPNILVILDSELEGPDDVLETSRQRYLDSKALQCWIGLSTRDLENMYPVSVLAEVTACAQTPVITPFMKYQQMTEALEKAGAQRMFKKVELGRAVARSLTIEQANAMPMVQTILNWIASAREP